MGSLHAAGGARPVTVKSTPGVINGEDMTRVRAVEAWLDKGGPPPQSWEVKTKADVSIGKELARGRSKCVRHGRLGTRKVVVVAVCPVSNSSAFAGHNYKELHAAGEALKRRHHLVEEMYFLEVLRGRPGIPTLRGAFLENGDLSIVVDDCGARITGVDHKKQPIASDAWRAFAKRDPLGAARALLEVFRSVVDYGGYLIKDFTPHQFTLHGNKLYLVDGPDVALDGPMAAFLRGRPGLCGNQPVDGETESRRVFERAALLAHAEGLPRGVPGDADALLARTGVLLPLSRHLRLDGGPGATSTRRVAI